MKTMDAEDLAVVALAGLNTPTAAKETGDEVSARDTDSPANNNSSKAKEAIEVVAAVASPSGNDSFDMKSKQVKRRMELHKFPVEPRTIQVIKKPRTHMNHSYRDFSSVPAEMNYKDLEKISEMTFSQKVHHMLSQEEYKKLVDWSPHGRTFRVKVPALFEKHISEKYFGHKRYSSFLRHLSNNGFKHISNGPDRNSYYHEFILRGLPHLTKYMPEPKDARRLIPDPDNEPDFYAISSKYPLPDDPDFHMVNPEEKVEKSTKTEAVAAPRLASEASWFNDDMSPAKRPALERNMDAQLHEVMHGKNQLLSLAALQANLGGLHQKPQAHAFSLGDSYLGPLAHQQHQQQAHALALAPLVHQQQQAHAHMPAFSLGDYPKLQQPQPHALAPLVRQQQQLALVHQQQHALSPQVHQQQQHALALSPLVHQQAQALAPLGQHSRAEFLAALLRASSMPAPSSYGGFYP